MYRLYVDEVGTDSFAKLDSDSGRYLSLTGVIIRKDHVRDWLNPALSSIKARCLPHDPDDVVCLHRVDIRNARGPFESLKHEANRKEFDRSIMALIADTNYTVITVLIDKLAMSERDHWSQSHPYHFLMNVLVEKYALFLERHDATGDIMPEARGKKQDKQLQLQFDDSYKNGTRYVSAQLVQKRLNAKQLKFRTKKDDISGLQLCDMIAHPSHYILRASKGHNVHLGRFCEEIGGHLMGTKYDRSSTGRVDGYGQKYLP